MKNILFVLVITLVSTSIQAQDAINNFFGKYQNDDSFTQVNISSKMFGMFTNISTENKDDQQVLSAISKLKGLRILAKDNTPDARKLYKEAFSLLPVKEFEELMSVRDKDKDMKFLIKESGGKISELVMIVGGTKEFMVMTLVGDIDLNQISRIGKSMDIKGLENLEKIKDHK
jgi:hypothetical protein